MAEGGWKYESVVQDDFVCLDPVDGGTVYNDTENRPVRERRIQEQRGHLREWISNHRGICLLSLYRYCHRSLDSGHPGDRDIGSTETVDRQIHPEPDIAGGYPDCSMYPDCSYRVSAWGFYEIGACMALDRLLYPGVKTSGYNIVHSYGILGGE